MSQIDPDYDEEDERLDRELFELIFKGTELPEGMTYAQAIGKAMAAAVPIGREIVIDPPSEERVQEWIRVADERRKERQRRNMMFAGAVVLAIIIITVCFTGRIL